MNKINHGLNWHSGSENYFENKIYAWIVNPKNTEEQFLVFELFENEFYILERDKRNLKKGSSDFLTNKESCSFKTEKEALDIVEKFRKKKYHFVVDWWNDHYSKEGLGKVSIKSLYDLCLITHISLHFNIAFSIMKKSNLSKRKKDEYQQIKLYSDVLNSNKYALSYEEVNKTSNEKLKNIVDAMTEREESVIRKNKLVLKSYVLTKNTLYYIFLKSIKSRDKDLFNYLIKNISLLSLDSFECYDSFLYALEMEKRYKDSYFINKLMSLKKISGYKLGKYVSDLEKNRIIEILLTYNSKHSKSLLKNEFKYKKGL